MVAAAILLAEWQVRDTPHIAIPYLYPVDLRHLLTPPVDATASTNPLGVATYLAKIKQGTELADLAADIVETFRSDLSEGLIQQSLLHFTLQYAGSPPGLPEIVMATDGGIRSGRADSAEPDCGRHADRTAHRLRRGRRPLRDT